MPVADTVSTMAVSETQSVLRELRAETIVFTLLALSSSGCFLMASSVPFPGSLDSRFLGLMGFALAVGVWVLHKWDTLLAAWVLVVGCMALVVSLVGWANLTAGIYLLALPASVAALSVSVAGGAGTAVACTLLLAFAPLSLLPSDGSQRLVTLVGLWSTLGLICFALRPLLTALEWSWSSHEQSRRLVERMRDYQVQLKQTLEDLARANVQLTRLNRLAQTLRQAAEDARRAKEQFVANVSHELRTPLNMIVGFGEMIMGAPDAYGAHIPPALLADLEVILRNSQHLSALIDDVLDLSQIEAGRMALTKEWVGLKEIVESAVVAVRPLFDSKGLYLVTDVENDLPLVFCDRTRIREVLLNLLSNAGRFTEDGGVHVRFRRHDGDLVGSVADTGPGIAGEHIDRLFKPFEQLDGSLRRVAGGSGLGLSISRAFVEMHGGKMWLESEVGKGTIFYFRLPVRPPAPPADNVSRWFSPHWHYEERARPPLAAPPVIRPRFAILERGDALQRLLNRHLDNIEIAAVGSLEKAIEEAARVPVRALLVNDQSVSDALQRLQQAALPYGTPAIVCSVPGHCEAAGSLGIADYLVKPISRERLLATLAKLQLRGKTLLVVDDEPEVPRLFQRMLTGAPGGPYRILRASNGRQALHLLHTERADLILLDLIMPGMDGFRLLEARTEDAALRDIPIVVTSARDPAGQPVVSNALGITCSGGLSIPLLLALIQSISAILSTAGQLGDPAPRGGPLDSPACA